MKTKKRRLGLLIISIVILSSLACHVLEALEPFTQNLSSEEEKAMADPFSEDFPCFEKFILPDGYKIECSGEGSSILNSFTGSIKYIGSNYVESAKFIMKFHSEGESEDEPFCEFNLAHVAPNETTPLTCEFTTGYCASSASGYATTCELETYTDYLDAQELDEEAEDNDTGNENCYEGGPLPTSGNLNTSFTTEGYTGSTTEMITVDFSSMRFDYSLEGSDEVDPTIWTYSGDGSGIIYEDGWFEGDINKIITKTCMPEYTCGEISLEGSTNSFKLVGFIDIRTSKIWLCEYLVDDERAAGWDLEKFRQCQCSSNGCPPCCPSLATHCLDFTFNP